MAGSGGKGKKDRSVDQHLDIVDQSRRARAGGDALGAVSNNTAGDKSLKHSPIRDSMKAIKVVLAGGPMARSRT